MDMFKVNYKDTNETSLKVSLIILIDNFEQIKQNIQCII